MLSRFLSQMWRNIGGYDNTQQHLVVSLTVVLAAVALAVSLLSTVELGAGVEIFPVATGDGAKTGPFLNGKHTVNRELDVIVWNPVKTSQA